MVVGRRDDEERGPEELRKELQDQLPRQQMIFSSKRGLSLSARKLFSTVGNTLTVSRRLL